MLRCFWVLSSALPSRRVRSKRYRNRWAAERIVPLSLGQAKPIVHLSLHLILSCLGRWGVEECLWGTSRWVGLRQLSEPSLSVDWDQWYVFCAPKSDAGDRKRERGREGGREGGKFQQRPEWGRGASQRPDVRTPRLGWPFGSSTLYMSGPCASWRVDVALKEQICLCVKFWLNGASKWKLNCYQTQNKFLKI